MRAPVRVVTSVFAILLLLPLLLSPGASAPIPESLARAGPVTHRSVLGSVGTQGGAGGLEVYGTLAQPTPIGVGSAAGVKLYAGFWTPGQRATAVTPDVTRRNRLEQNYPNPFNPRTRIQYEIADGGLVLLEVLNLRGERLRVLVASEQSPGLHHVEWDGCDDRGHHVSTGIYFYRLQVGEFATVKKMLLMK